MATTAFFRSVQSTWLEVQHTLEETRGWAGRSDIFVLSSDAGAANTQTHIHTHAHVGRWGWRRSPGMSEEMGRGVVCEKKRGEGGGRGRTSRLAAGTTTTCITKIVCVFLRSVDVIPIAGGTPPYLRSSAKTGRCRPDEAWYTTPHLFVKSRRLFLCT